MKHNLQINRVVSLMLLVAALLTMANVAWAASETSPQRASCCAGYPPCTVEITHCGWCYAGNCVLGQRIRYNGTIKLKYDANCNQSVESAKCSFFPCGLEGCN